MKEENNVFHLRIDMSRFMKKRLFDGLIADSVND